MNGLALKSLTTTPEVVSKVSPITGDVDLFDHIEISQERIDSFSKDPTIETELDDLTSRTTLLSLPIEKQNLLRIEQNRVYRQKTSISSQSWKGYVTAINDEYFSAVIKDLSGNSQDEEVEIPFKAISLDDLHLVIEGATFDWHIGYEQYSGTTQKYSKMLFRRMPRWTTKDFEKAQCLKQKFKVFLSNGS